VSWLNDEIQASKKLPDEEIAQSVPDRSKGFFDHQPASQPQSGPERNADAALVPALCRSNSPSLRLTTQCRVYATKLGDYENGL
jgi:hypothetical protein